MGKFKLEAGGLRLSNDDLTQTQANDLLAEYVPYVNRLVDVQPGLTPVV